MNHKPASEVTLRRSGFLFAAVFGVTTVAAWLALNVRDSAAELADPGPRERRVAFVVSSLLSRDHLLAHPLDDVASERAFKNILKQLDPMKFYFLQSDIDEFQAQVPKLDEQVKQGDIRFAYRVFRRFLERVDQRLIDVEQLITAEHDFTLKETMITDPEKRAYAQNPQDARELWRKRVKYDLLRLKADEKEGEEATERLQRRYRSFGKRMHQFESDELLEMYLTAFTTSYDPHTTYMSRSTLDNFQISMSLKLEGIGAALEMDDGYTKVIKIIPGGAADKAGQLQPEDRIVSVAQGEDGPMEEVIDMKLTNVVQKIRGAAGTIVRLGVIPAGATETKVYTIKREKIQLEDSAAKSVILDRGTKSDGSPYKIGVIDLPSFYMDMKAARNGEPDFRSTTRDMRLILEDFNTKGVDAVVLNLRRNGGGSLTEAIDLTGLFIDQGPVVQVKNADGVVQPYADRDAGMLWNGPLVVITSQFSASASEILAGAIKDYGRGIVVGDEATHGKGTVQSLLDLGQQIFPGIANRPNLGALKITIQKFYRPGGDSTQKRGVLADVSLPSLTTHMDVGEKDLDFAVDFDRVRSAPFRKYKMVSDAIVKELNDRSAERREVSEDFAKLDRDIARYRDQKERDTISLNEEEFFKEREELDAEEEDEKELKEQVGKDKEVFELNFANTEVLDIAVDYLQLLQNSAVAQVP